MGAVVAPAAIAITGKMVLASDAAIVPVSELPPGIQQRLGARTGDCTIARAHARTPDKIVDRATADLLLQFRNPTRIVDAVIAFSRSRGLDPTEVLVSSIPLLRDVFNARLLVLAGSSDAGPITPTLRPGQGVGGFSVERCIQVLLDSEVYQVRRKDGVAGALKIARPGESNQVVVREAEVLNRIHVAVVPRLLRAGTARGRAYLISEWRSGRSPDVLAAELRDGSRAGRRTELLAMCRAIVQAYVQLHAQGIVHADVGPRNLIAQSYDEITIIDLGLCVWPNEEGSPSTVPRGRPGLFGDPECAAAVAAGRTPPGATMESEQYSIAALLYYLITGHPYCSFSPNESEMLRQIVEDDPLPFSAQGCVPWPAVESILAKALRKAPEDRWTSLSALATALARVPQSSEPVVPVTTRTTRSLVAGTLDRLRPGGRIFVAGLAAAPRSSVNLGAAGIAYGLYRIASVRDDPSLLAAADIWLDRARRTIGRPEEWFAEEAGIMPRSVGPISLYHTRVGLYSVAAILNQALGDRLGQHTAITSFIAASRVACRNPDLTLGRSGVLLACALLLEGIPAGAGNDASLLTDFGNETMDWLVHRIAAWPAIQHQRCPFPNLGMAHGWAGILYALLRWHQCTQVPVAPTVSGRLAQLAATAQSSGRGAVWPWLGREGGQTISKEAVPGWCNGSAGFVFLWSLAHLVTGDDRWLALAERAGLEAADNPSPEWSLCCGLTGRGFALLNLYKHTGDPRWLRRAKQLAARAAGGAATAGASDGDGYLYSLYRGLTGLTNFLVDLERPQEACMPMFEAEGWR